MIDWIGKPICYEPVTVAKDEQLRATPFIFIAEKRTCELILRVQPGNGPTLLANLDVVLRDEPGIFVNLLNRRLLDLKLAIQIAPISANRVHVCFGDD
jgi:hypothetical protein